jgi:aspartate aminotransferase
MSTELIADRVRRIRISPSTAAANRARELREAGVALIDLTVGEPDFDTPEHIKAAAVAAIAAGETKYTAVNGTTRLRNAIISRLRAHTGVEYGHDQITVGGGAKQVIFMALMATLNRGDEVIIPAPYWVSYPDMVLANDGTPVVVEATAENNFKITADQLRGAITSRSKWLILNAPGNPSGAIYSEPELRDIAAVLTDHPHVHVLTDEIYDEIAFGPTPPVSLVRAAPDLRDRVFLVNGVSKAYAMTGWRLGYGVGPSDLVNAINKLQSQISSCPSSISQAAAAAALTGDQSFVSEALEVYRKRRDLAVAGFDAVDGLSCGSPDGAFYVLVNCQGAVGKRTPSGRTIDSDQDFAVYLLEHAGVAVIQGSAYGVSPYFRISFATSEENIQSAVDAVAKAMEALT